MSGCFHAAVVGLSVETMGAKPGGLFGNQTPTCHPSLLSYPKVYQSCPLAHREPKEGESSEASPSACPWEKSTHGISPTSYMGNGAHHRDIYRARNKNFGSSVTGAYAVVEAMPRSWL